tara:strand:+ start:834 stop:1091 length:258 start_codon:yes stop_codon:yes gene_type:complete
MKISIIESYNFVTSISKGLLANDTFTSLYLTNKKKSHPQEKIDKITTPSECKIKGLIKMENQGLNSAIISGLVSPYQKTNNILKL